MQHLDGMVAPEENISDDEIQFRFFKVHDYDNNNKLDGIELTASLTDYHGKGSCFTEMTHGVPIGRNLGRQWVK